MLADTSALARFAPDDFPLPTRNAALAAPRLVPVSAPEPIYSHASTYGQGGVKRQAPAAVVAFAAVSLLFSTLVWMNVHEHHHRHHRVMAVDLKLDPPAPPKQQPKPEVEKVELPTTPTPVQQPVVTPEPMPAPVALSPAPAPAPVVQAPPAPPAAPAAPPPKAVGPAEGGDLSAKMLSFTAPSYPLESRRNKEEGTVALSLLLGTDGRVAEISIASSSGFARLDKAALEAVRKWRWSPVMRGGEAVQVRGTVKIPFIIKH
ncbi:energy transducer TonB [Novosphingobium rosa]|uniref:energy transducer TonB n=1 Tax=Novosphingobium rosa TaxID=76978 RepID=UPI000835AF03|nr:energy transducer TonB [Novosphingobium rosa]